MHIPTHILSGWCIGNLLPLNGRERLFCMIAAGAADFDGLGILFGEETYWDFHHKLGHNVFFAVLLSGVLASLSSRKCLAFEVFFVLAHLHLVLDYVGSGPGWPLYYLWPVSNMETFNPRAWPFFSWQNIATVQLRERDRAGAEASLRRALEIDPQLPGAYTTLGVVLSNTGRKAEAVDAWKRAVALEPSEFDALYNLIVTLTELGRRDEARPYADRYIAEAPPAFYARDIERVRMLIGRND